MNSPICVSKICVTNRKQTASFRFAGLLLLAIAPLWLVMAAANTPAQAQTTPSADWTQFHRDNMQRWNPYETVLGVKNVSGLKLKWSFDFGSMAEQFSSPAVVNGVVYVGSSNNDSVYALNASTGAKLWSFPTGGSVTSSPAVANGVVYFGAYDFAVTNLGYMYALNASTGAELWAYDAGGSLNNYSEYSSPAVANGVVYVGNLGTGTDDVVYAVNASTGAELWSYTATGPVHVTSSPAVANGVVYIGSPTANSNGGNDTLYALNASTGALLWSFTPVYHSPLQLTFYSSPAVADGVVYISSNNSAGTIREAYVYALNAETGALLWSYTIAASIGASSPAVANGVAYISAGDGLYALNVSTGVKLWSYATGGGVDSSPAVANGVVYVGSDNGDVYALNASTGAKLWSYAFGSPEELGVFSSPTMVDGMLYVTSGVSLYAFGLGAADTADLYLRIRPTPTTVHQGDLITYAFPVWNLGPANADSRSAEHAGSRGHDLRLHPHLRHAGTGHMHDSALPGNWRDRLSRKQRHGPKHHMDSAPDCEGNGSFRDSHYRKCDRNRRHA